MMSETSASVLPDFYRPTEIALKLGVCRRVVWRMIASGSIPHVRRGRVYYIPRGAWETWLRNQDEQALKAVRPAEEGQQEQNANIGQ